jgi:LysR substrate binding domain
MLQIRESIVVALLKDHKAARKKTVALKDLKGELFMIPSKDLFPSLHQLITTAFVQNHVPFKRYQMVESFQTAVALSNPRAGFALLSASAKPFVPEGVVLRAPSFAIRPLETLALWSNGNVEPLFGACSVFSRKSAPTCKSSLVVQVTPAAAAPTRPTHLYVTPRSV